MPNRLANEKSPYLLQHANNPVDWYPWCDEAFAAARRRNVPVFLSIGYSTCHWCHVMERESFDDPETAKILNEHFVCVKVDREERPDVDRAYMTVCTLLTGGGGWPLSIFMTPGGSPFLAGTYFPKSGRKGRPGFAEIISHVGQLWKKDPAGLVAAGGEVVSAIQPDITGGGSASPGFGVLDSCYGRLERAFDEKNGGFGDAPKFPTPHHLTFLLRYDRRRSGTRSLEYVKKTLDAMRRGGIFDHVGFGFHRYSVDAGWREPHFEKMITDQAMLAIAYAEAFQATGEERYAKTAGEVFEYVLRDMVSPDGAFYTAEDADSEGREGSYYLWTPGEVREALGEDRSVLFCRLFGIARDGNSGEGGSVPMLAKPLEEFAADFAMAPEALRRTVEECRAALFTTRGGRVRPNRDSKIVAAYNGLMIAALARGFMALRDGSYLAAACRAADFVLDAMRDETGRLYRCGRSGLPGYSDDYALLAWGLVELYEATLEPRYLIEAVDVTSRMVEFFWDEKNGGFYLTGHDAEKLILRDREIYDGAVPSANSVALLNILRIARVTGDANWEKLAGRMLSSFGPMVAEHPSAYTQFLCAVDFAVGPTREIAIAGDPQAEDTVRMVETLQKAFLPSCVWTLVPEGASDESRKAAEHISKIAPFTAGMKSAGGKATAYICENFACVEPAAGSEELARALGLTL